MQTKRSTWLGWSRALRRWDLEEPAAVLIEGAGPLTVLLGQIVIFGQPFLKSLLAADQWEVLAQMLGSQEESRDFVSMLREEALEE